MKSYIDGTIYNLGSWVSKAVNGFKADKYKSLILDEHEQGKHWNNNIYLKITSRGILLGVPGQNLYYGCYYAFKNDKAKEQGFKAIKGLFCFAPEIISEGKDCTYTYKKYESKLKLYERLKSYDPDSKASNAN